LETAPFALQRRCAGDEQPAEVSRQRSSGVPADFAAQDEVHGLRA